MTVSDAQSQVPVDGRLQLAAAEVVDSYRAAFGRRLAASGQRDAPAFKNPEPNALLALGEVWLCGTKSSNATLERALKALVACTRPLLEQARDHGIAIDMAGLAWADAYGVLPMRQVPTAQLEWVLESGNRPGAIRGLTGGAWRAAFLGSTSGLLDWQHRPIAERELSRWKGYVDSKLETISPPTAFESSPVSLHARLIFALTLAAERLADVEIAEAGLEQLHAINELRTGDTLTRMPAAVLAQLAAANFRLGQVTVALELCTCLLENYLNEETQLVRVAAAPSSHDELSPWILLALLPAADGAEAQLGRGLRRRLTFWKGR